MNYRKKKYNLHENGRRHLTRFHEDFLRRKGFELKGSKINLKRLYQLEEVINLCKAYLTYVGNHVILM